MSSLIGWNHGMLECKQICLALLSPNGRDEYRIPDTMPKLLFFLDGVKKIFYLVNTEKVYKVGTSFLVMGVGLQYKIRLGI
jgi:hypothetical protein